MLESTYTMLILTLHYSNILYVESNILLYVESNILYNDFNIIVKTSFTHVRTLIFVYVPFSRMKCCFIYCTLCHDKYYKI